MCADMPFMKSNGKFRVEGTRRPVRFVRRMLTTCVASALVLDSGLAAMPYGKTSIPNGRKLNNLVALLLDVVPAPATQSFPFVRSSDDWVFISFTTHGGGAVRLTLDKASPGETPIHPAPGSGPTYEAMHHVTKGRHARGEL
jgi:hypothetical protein